MKEQYFYRQKGGWVIAKPRFIFSEQDEYAIAQKQGPMIGLCITPETLRIRGQAFEYVVLERWDGRVHHRSIEFESGERVDVEYGYFPRGLKRGRVIASLIPSSTKLNVEAEIISAEELGNGTIIQRMSSSSSANTGIVRGRDDWCPFEYHGGLIE